MEMHDALRKIWQIEQQGTFPGDFHDALSAAIDTLTNVMFQIETKKKNKERTLDSVRDFWIVMNDFIHDFDGLEGALVEGNLQGNLNKWQWLLFRIENEKIEVNDRTKDTKLMILPYQVYAIYEAFCTLEKRDSLPRNVFESESCKYVPKKFIDEHYFDLKKIIL
jgi:hypothetical protein